MIYNTPTRVLLRINNKQVSTTETDLKTYFDSLNRQYDPSVGDCYEIFGMVRSELAGTLRIYQAFANGNSPAFVVKDDIAVAAAGAFADGNGVKVAPIRLLGQLVKVTFQLTSGGPSSNFQLYLAMR